MADDKKSAKKGSKERRENERCEFEGDVKVKVLFTKSNELKEIDAKIGDVSEGGLRLVTKEPIEEGALADLKFKLGTRGSKNPLGLVKWVTPGKGVGIEFFYSCEEEKEEIKRELTRLFGKKVVEDDGK